MPRTPWPYQNLTDGGMAGSGGTQDIGRPEGTRAYPGHLIHFLGLRRGAPELSHVAKSYECRCTWLMMSGFSRAKK